jgi:predicted SAM-dependent methyltransferase
MLGSFLKHTSRGLHRAFLVLLAEASMMRVHRKGVRRARTIALPCKLHFGSGDNLKAGWVNVDLHASADLRLDVREPLPFPDNSVTMIYSEHFFEHLTFEDGCRFLRECWRVLQPGSILSTGIPDAEAILRVYAEGDVERWRRTRDRWHPAWCTTMMHSVNYHFRQDGEHHYAYDFETLAESLTNAGFVNVHRRDWDPALDQESRRGATLYVDAVKP